MRKFLETQSLWTKDNEIVWMTTYVHFPEGSFKDASGRLTLYPAHYTVSLELTGVDEPVWVSKCTDIAALARKQEAVRLLVKKSKRSNLV